MTKLGIANDSGVGLKIVCRATKRKLFEGCRAEIKLFPAFGKRER